MPATYRVKAKPTPPLYPAKPQKQEPKPMPPRKYFVLGIETDYETYRKFTYESSWTIDGDILTGIPCSLWDLENYYSTESHAQDHPVEVANARKLMEQIREEVHAANNSRKDDKPMTTPKTAADFIDALSDIFAESRNAYTTLQSKVDTAAKKLEQARADMKKPGCNQAVAEAQLTIAKGELQLAESNRRTAYQDMLSNHKKKVGKLRERFAAHLEEHYSASPDKLDNATMQLLGTGICTPSELSRLVDRHQGNPTMLRILGGHARKLRDSDRNMSAENRAICSAVAAAGYSAKDGSRELEIFDTAVSTLDYGLDKNAEHAARMAAHVPEWMDGYKAKMDNLPVIPEEMAPTPKPDSSEGGNE